MARGRARLEWDQTSLLWSLLANCNRDDKKRPQPFLPSDVNPFRDAKEYKAQNSEPDLAAIAQIKRQYKVSRLKRNGKPQHRGRESFFAPPG